VQWNRQRLAARIQLGRFTVAETNTMIATLFGQARVSGEFAEAIHRETEGNPFFIEEVAKALVEQGQIYWAGDHWEREELEDLAIPQSIKEAIGRRLNRLSQACIDVLHTAAVIGKDFAYDLLAVVSGEDEATILNALDEATSSQLILPLAGESFIFTHDKIREVLYDEILSVRRHRLHKSIVLALESGQDGKADAQAEDLAYHAISAGLIDKGLVYARRAAENAEALFAFDEALQSYRQARECALSLGDDGAQASILEAMADIYSVKGPYATAVECYRDAIAFTTAPKDRAALSVKIGLVHSQTNNDEGMTILEEALEVLDPEKQPLVVAIALGALGRFYHYRCQYSTVIELSEKALKLAEPLDDPFTLTLLYAYLTAAYQHMARIEESMIWARRVEDVGLQRDFPMAIATAHEFMSENNIILGHWDQALKSAKIDIQVGQKIGSTVRASWGYWSSGYALWGKGNLSHALDDLDLALDIATSLGENRLQVLCNITLALVHTDLGNEREAFEYLEKALEQSRQMVECFQQGNAGQISGYVHLYHGQWRQAADLYRSTLEEMAQTENRDVALMGQPYYAETLYYLGEYEEATKVVEASFALTQEVGATCYEGITHRVHGQLLCQQGDFAKAAAAFDKAEQQARETNTQLELGRVATQRALMHQQAGEDDLARQQATEAKTIFAACQAARDLDKVDALLAQR
jgi:tetratricopeptide (TPR) repeat protein